MRNLLALGGLVQRVQNGVVIHQVNRTLLLLELHLILRLASLHGVELFNEILDFFIDVLLEILLVCLVSRNGLFPGVQLRLGFLIFCQHLVEKGVLDLGQELLGTVGKTRQELVQIFRFNELHLRLEFLQIFNILLCDLFLIFLTPLDRFFLGVRLAQIQGLEVQLRKVAQLFHF